MNRLETLLSILMKPYQRLENALIQVRDGYDPNTAVGAQLDVLGKKVGQPRNGLTDDVYRRYIKARIAANRSTGKREELLRIARLVLGDDNGQIIIRTRSNASFIFEIQDRAVDTGTAAALQDMLTDAVGLAIRIVIAYINRPLSQTFRLDSGPGLDVGHLARGIDDTGTP